MTILNNKNQLSCIKLDVPENNFKNEVIKGRNLHEGFFRSYGLHFGDFKNKINKDKLFQKALSLSKHKTIVGLERLMNIYLILTFFLDKIPKGHIVEFGAYKGGSAIFMSYICKHLHPEVKIYALDTFEGMPCVDNNKDWHKYGDFNSVNLEELNYFTKKHDLNNLEFIKGNFEDTAENLLETIGNIALAHIDCDIYSSVKYSYEISKKYMVNGGYIVFDDATECSCPGATEVIEDILIKRDGLNSEQICPHFVFRHFD